jgi:hypothetical protein
MKATLLKEYQQKIEPDMSLKMVTAWAKRKSQISKKIGFFLRVHVVSKNSDMSG